MAGPRGLGIYFLRLPSETPLALARRLADAGVSWVGICGPWHDAEATKQINRPAAIARYAAALGARDIETHVWGYPWHDRVELFVRAMVSSTPPACAGWLLDPELGMRGRPAALTRLITSARDAMGDGVLGLTSYGSTSVPFPWSSVRGLDYGSPQLYTAGARAIGTSLEAWSRLGVREVAPSFGFYTRADGTTRARTAAELDAHLARFLDRPTRVRAMIGWSWRWIRASHWRVLTRYAERIR